MRGGGSGGSDDTANPADPNQTPSPGGYDDELYDIAGFVGSDTSVLVETANPSDDDILFAARLFVAVPEPSLPWIRSAALAAIAGRASRHRAR